MKKLLTLLLSGMLMGVLWSSVQAQDSGPFHPMDGLTPEEIQLGVSLLRNCRAEDRARCSRVMTAIRARAAAA